MKKFEEIDIHGIGLMQMQGPQMVEFLQKLMNNQNEIIDKLQDLFDKIDFYFPEEED